VPISHGKRPGYLYLPPSSSSFSRVFFFLSSSFFTGQFSGNASHRGRCTVLGAVYSLHVSDSVYESLYDSVLDLHIKVLIILRRPITTCYTHIRKNWFKLTCKPHCAEIRTRNRTAIRMQNRTCRRPLEVQRPPTLLPRVTFSFAISVGTRQSEKQHQIPRGLEVAGVSREIAFKYHDPKAFVSSGSQSHDRVCTNIMDNFTYIL
jgi:hypothetical protein